MAKRKSIPSSTQAEVLVRCRRRCCVCFGLKQDKQVKKGNVAHLDQNPENNALDNLAFLCLDHHDEFDGATSQAKGLTRREVEIFRDELHAYFASWRVGQQREHILNFLAAEIDLDRMAETAVQVASRFVFYGRDLAYQALTQAVVESVDGDTYLPLLGTLDYYASWGWLTFAEEEAELDLGPGVRITVHHEPVCGHVAARMKSRESKQAGGAREPAPP